MGWLKKEIVDINRSRHELFDGWHAYLTLTAVVFFAFGLASCADTATTQIPVKDVTASRTIDEMVPPRVLDGDTATHWGAGSHPPQWIQLDLGEETSISEVRLCISQTPDGPTTHEVYAGATPEQLKLIGTLAATTQDNQWIELSASANNVRYVKILTVNSPSWVGWREIEVYR
jgi:hypothetical protein